MMFRHHTWCSIEMGKNGMRMATKWRFNGQQNWMPWRCHGWTLVFGSNQNWWDFSNIGDGDNRRFIHESLCFVWFMLGDPVSSVFSLVLDCSHHISPGFMVEYRTFLFNGSKKKTKQYQSLRINIIEQRLWLGKCRYVCLLSDMKPPTSKTCWDLFHGGCIEQPNDQWVLHLSIR